MSSALTQNILASLRAFATRLVLAILPCAILPCAIGVPAEAQPVPVKREILALYDGGQEGSADGTRIHRFAELPLNHLGFIVRFLDIRDRLPDPAAMARYRGVLTWFVGPVPDTSAYLAWAGQVSQMPVRFAILGDVGVDPTPANLFLINRLLGAIGLRHTGDLVAPTRGSRVTHKDARLVEYECRLDPVLPDYPVISVVDATSRIGLAVQVPARDGTSSTTLVAIGAKGGYAAFNYEFCHQRAPTHRGRWMIDPFAFFHAAFGADVFPVPDVTTVSGRRLYFGQLHSEGWSNETKVERYRQQREMAAEVVLRELIEPFADLPVTLDLRNSNLDRAGRSAQRAREIAEKTLALPQVERPGRHIVGTVLSRFDTSYPSISSLSALVSSGNEMVFYTGTGDENAYAGNDQRAMSGFLALAETLRKTENPRRLKPFNLNYHVYAGQHPASLQVVKEHLQAARAAPLAPIAASHYSEIVGGFYTTTIARTGPMGWSIANRGAMQTVRFDATEGLAVDLAASVGVLGHTRHGEALYVALDENVDVARIGLAPLVAPAAASLSEASLSETGGTAGLVLGDSRWRVRKLVRAQCYLSFEAHGYGPGEFAWSGATGTGHRITVARGGEVLWQQSVTSDGSGRLAFVVPLQAIEPVTIEVICSDAGGN